MLPTGHGALRAEQLEVAQMAQIFLCRRFSGSPSKRPRRALGQGPQTLFFHLNLVLAGATEEVVVHLGSAVAAGASEGSAEYYLSDLHTTRAVLFTGVPNQCWSLPCPLCYSSLLVHDSLRRVKSVGLPMLSEPC